MAENIRSKSLMNLVYFMVIMVLLLVMYYFVIKPLTGNKQEAQIQYLWNGKDLSGWQFFLADSTARPDSVFYIKDDVIRIEGAPFGYMRTPSVYSDFHLHVEWRWPGAPGNSGVFLNITGPDQQWPKTIECQLKSGNAGDFVFLGGSDANEHVDKSAWVVPKYQATVEKAAGEWNSYDIHARNDSILVYVNNTLQNICTSPDPDNGFIGLQSEGAPIEFKNIYVEVVTPGK